MKRFDGFEDLLKSQCQTAPGQTALLFEAGGGKKELSWSALFAGVKARAAELEKKKAACLGV